MWWYWSCINLKVKRTDALLSLRANKGQYKKVKTLKNSETETFSCLLNFQSSFLYGQQHRLIILFPLQICGKILFHFFLGNAFRRNSGGPFFLGSTWCGDDMKYGCRYKQLSMCNLTNWINFSHLLHYCKGKACERNFHRGCFQRYKASSHIFFVSLRQSDVTVVKNSRKFIDYWFDN